MITEATAHAAHLPPDVRRQLREMADRQALTDLVSRQGLWLDEKRFDEARAIFTEDATVVTPGGRAEGIERLIEQARRNHAPYERLQHATTNVLIELEGDRATVRANLIATFVRRADSPDAPFQLGERYRFTAVRTPDGWRFSSVEVVPVWKTGARAG